MTDELVIEENRPKDINGMLADAERKLRMLDGELIENNEQDKQLTAIELSNKIYARVNKMALVDKLGKPKKFNLRRKIKGNIESTLRKSSVVVITLKKSRAIGFETHQVVNGCILVNKVPRPINEDMIYLLEINRKQYPCIILPEWELSPLGTSQYYTKFPNGLSLESAVQLIYAYSKSNELQAKQGGGPVVLVIVGVIAVAVVFFILSGGFTQ